MGKATGKPRGRPPGSVSKLDKVARAKALEGLTPLDYLLSVMRNEATEDDVRRDAAKAAAPYVHARLSSIDANVNGKVGVTVEIIRFGDK